MRSYLLVALIVITLVGGVLGWTHRASAAGEKPAVGAAAVVAPEANPVVSMLAGNVETTFEQDPFDQTKVRRSLMKVKSLIIVHADGTVETKAAP